MNLGTASALLGQQSRDFSEVYKLYDFKDDASLVSYLDFIVHEPVAWLEGFPSRFITKAAFNKPKAAVIKLLKQPEVLEALGQEYVVKIHDIVWSSFKKHADQIVSKRSGGGGTGAEDASPQLEVESVSDTISVASSVKSVKKNKWEHKYRILASAYRALANGDQTKANLILLEAFSSA